MSYCGISQLKIVIISEDLSPSEYHLCPAPTQNLGGHELNGDREVGTGVTRLLKTGHGITLIMNIKYRPIVQ